MLSPLCNSQQFWRWTLIKRCCNGCERANNCWRSISARLQYNSFLLEYVGPGCTPGWPDQDVGSRRRTMSNMFLPRRSLALDAKKTLLNAFVASRLHYCNSLYHGIKCLYWTDCSECRMRRQDSLLELGNTTTYITPVFHAPVLIPDIFWRRKNSPPESEIPPYKNLKNQ